MRDFSTAELVDIATDFDLHEPFTFSYWIHMNSENEMKRVMRVTMSNTHVNEGKVVSRLLELDDSIYFEIRTGILCTQRINESLSAYQ